MDKPTWIADNNNGTYNNPILFTDYSDPDVIRVGSEYFMIASSFSNAPAIPVLHSKDLVNWKVINYVLDRIPFERYDKPRHGKGVWAPAIRYHDGLFYACFPLPHEGIFMCTTDDPFKKWSEPVCIKEVQGWIDPCLFWDDNGKVYLAHAFSKGLTGKNSLINICQLSDDAMSVVSESVTVFDGNNTQPVIEGPKLYKRNGYYYIFAPAGSVKTGWQTVLRSKYIYGPYEERIVMLQGETHVNGPHQGGWVETESQEGWFVHFQYVPNCGRITHLQPLVWENDWPIIGKYADGAVYGRPVFQNNKPKVDVSNEIVCPDDSDDFTKEKLGLQWQWNANYKKHWYEIDTEHKQLRLNSQLSVESLFNTPNILLQKWTARELVTECELVLDELKVGDLAGVIAFGAAYGAIGVECLEQGKRLVIITGSSKEEKRVPISEVYDDISTLRITMYTNGKTGRAMFVYSINNQAEVKYAEQIVIRDGNWVGIKNGLFSINTQSENSGGVVKVNYFNMNKWEE